jgi:hypothetical protein
LGLPQDMALDGWDNFFSYYVSNVPANSNTDWTLTTSFRVGDLGAFNVYSTTGNTNFLANASPLVRTGAVVLIVSHGKNGLGAITQQGTSNTPATNDEYLNTLACKAAPGSAPLCTGVDFWKRDATDNALVLGGPFDDIVLFLEPGDLITPLIKDGTLQGPISTTRQTLSGLSDIVMSGAVSSIPAGAINAPALPVDAWGNPIIWTPSFVAGGHVTTLCAVPTAVVYTLTSNGPDGLNGTADDVIFPITVANVTKVLTSAGVTMSGGACGM